MTVAVVVIIAACGGGDGGGGGSSIELDGLTGDFGARVEAPGGVVSVSPAGHVLVARDDQTCIVELDGTEGPCVDVALSPGEPLRWTSDGTRTVAGDQRALARLEDPDLVVIDVEEGDVEVVTDDGTDDAMEAAIDLFPTWLDDETIAFLRLDGFEGERLRLATVTVDGEVDVKAETDLELIELTSGGGTFDGQLLVVAQPDRRSTELLVVDDEGGTEEVFDFEGFASPLGQSSADGRALAVPTADARLFTLGPVAYLRADEDPVVSDFVSFAAVVDPAGGLVATTTGEDVAAMQLTVWDPAGGTTVDLGEIEAPRGITWTTDDRLVLWDTGGWQVVVLGEAP